MHVPLGRPFSIHPRLAKTLGLQRTFFLGAKGQDVVAEIFSMSEVGVFPSYKNCGAQRCCAAIVQERHPRQLWGRRAICSRIGRHRRAELEPKLAEHTPTPVKFGPNSPDSCQMLLEVAKAVLISTSIGWHRPVEDQARLIVGRTRPTLGQFWPNIGRMWSETTGLCPISAKSGTTSGAAELRLLGGFTRGRICILASQDGADTFDSGFKLRVGAREFGDLSRETW